MALEFLSRHKPKVAASSSRTSLFQQGDIVDLAKKRKRTRRRSRSFGQGGGVMRVRCWALERWAGAMARTLAAAGHDLRFGTGHVSARGASIERCGNSRRSRVGGRDRDLDAHGRETRFARPTSARAAPRRGRKRASIRRDDTAGPEVSRRSHPWSERSGAQLVEAPVMGSIGASRGQALYPGAGDEAAIERGAPSSRGARPRSEA